VGAPDLTADELEGVRALLVTGGAADAVEREISALVDEALDALDRCQIGPAARDALRRLCGLVAWRER
jgi:hypothetical protein